MGDISDHFITPRINHTQLITNGGEAKVEKVVKLLWMSFNLLLHKKVLKKVSGFNWCFWRSRSFHVHATVSFFISFQKPPLKSQLILFISKYKYIRTKHDKWLLKTQIFWKGKFHTSKLVVSLNARLLSRGVPEGTSHPGHMKVTFKHAKLPVRPFERVSFPTPTKRSPSSGNIQDLGIPTVNFKAQISLNGWTIPLQPISSWNLAGWIYHGTFAYMNRWFLW